MSPMNLIRHATAAAFLQRAGYTLEQDEAANNLMLGIATQLSEHPDRIKAPPYLATVEAAGELLAAAVMTPPHRLIIEASSAAAGPLRLIAEDLARDAWAVPGCIGREGTAQAFAEAWIAAHGGRCRVHMHQRVYALQRVTFPRSVPGMLRTASENELELIARWVYEFMHDAGLGGSVEEARTIAEQRIDEQNLFVWDDGCPVSMAAKTRHSTHGAVISLVYTPLAFRWQGYASACVAALSQRLLAAGWKFCALFADLANPTSNSIYQRIGYRPVCDFIEMIFE